jgi:hypothetical protein
VLVFIKVAQGKNIAGKVFLGESIFGGRCFWGLFVYDAGGLGD